MAVVLISRLAVVTPLPPPVVIPHGPADVITLVTATATLGVPRSGTLSSVVPTATLMAVD